ncbi:DUF732 domain-containing protein [Prescottella equi]|uniref:Dihydrofolate reductase n=1 Tax=Rhodococcus hoagii TaxID=43767 RepID=A0A9Q4ZYG4_RHOHA|nr:DUF732 domain-containing protein [Prescottella equi]MBU4615787.1 dihydrofolate reductase [Rhodococcus sp. GG48]MBM4490466.1 dihydrofolate reductase [Prescottella equi]MBM4501572.1 dihydrofolate reductase [Prescottella equi]MBM4508448.1 dihydrofolate reductase [Prescottella equi]MBM4515279.1 dihydrofolate reductase [Prescottella equi]
MTSTRAVTAAVAAAGALLLTACSGQDSTPEHTGHDASATSASPTTSTAAQASSPGQAAPAPATEPSTPPPAPTTTVAPPPPVTTVSPPAPRPAAPAAGGIDARSPEQVVAESGERGQRYLTALRGAGIPPTGMDGVEVLYAQGTCEALARGDSRSSVLAEFDSVGKAYAQFLPMPADRIAEIYVSTAEKTYC